MKGNPILAMAGSLLLILSGLLLMDSHAAANDSPIALPAFWRLGAPAAGMRP